jgi:hypothetical protein
VRSAVARAGWPTAIPLAGLTKMGRAETEEISQHAGILCLQRKEFFPRSQAAFHFHGTSLPYSQDRFNGLNSFWKKIAIPSPAVKSWGAKK